jgi:hypothetical protein
MFWCWQLCDWLESMKIRIQDQTFMVQRFKTINLSLTQKTNLKWILVFAILVWISFSTFLIHTYDFLQQRDTRRIVDSSNTLAHTQTHTQIREAKTISGVHYFSFFNCSIFSNGSNSQFLAINFNPVKICNKGEFYKPKKYACFASKKI